jgi:predicted nuclease with TOPRIM domain
MINKTYAKLIIVVLVMLSLSTVVYFISEYKDTKQQLIESQNKVNDLNLVIKQNEKNLEDLKLSSKKTEEILKQLKLDNSKLDKTIQVLTNKNKTKVQEIKQKFEELPQTQENIELKEKEISITVTDSINEAFCLVTKCEDN